MTIIGLAVSLLRPRLLRQRAEDAWRRRRERRYLLEADPGAIADLGVSRAQALFELDRDRSPSAPTATAPRRRPAPQDQAI